MQNIFPRIIVTLLLLVSMILTAHWVFFVCICLAGLYFKDYYESLVVMLIFWIGFVYPATTLMQYSILLLPVTVLIAHHLIRRYSTLYDFKID